MMKTYSTLLIGAFAVTLLGCLGIKGVFLIQWQWWAIILPLLLVGEAIDWRMRQKALRR